MAKVDKAIYVGSLPPQLFHWIGMRQSCPDQTIHGWWSLPSRSRPRIYIPIDSIAWRGGLALIHSKKRKLIAFCLLQTFSILRIKPHSVSFGESDLDRWLSRIFPSVKEFRYAIYSGTPNLFVKETIQCQDSNGNILCYVKLPRGAESGAMIENERHTLSLFSKVFPADSFYPKILGYRDGVTIQSPDNTHAGDFGVSYAAMTLIETLSRGYTKNFFWRHSPVRSDVAGAASDLEIVGASKWALTLEKGLKILGSCFGDLVLPHPFSHGDLVPWNLRPGPFAFDWEWAGHRLPWHDAFHFLWMPKILSSKIVNFEALWKIWAGKDGLEIRQNKPADINHLKWALAYLLWQFAFYSAASARNNEPVEKSKLLNTLYSLLESAISTVTISKIDRINHEIT